MCWKTGLPKNVFARLNESMVVAIEINISKCESSAE